MAQDTSSDIEDVGRMESERQLKKTQKRYLDDELERADADYNKIISLIEEGKAVGQGSDDSIHTIAKVLEDNVRSEETANTISGIKALLGATDELLQVHKQANHHISASNTNSTAPADYMQARQDDRERVKQILAAGRRVFEGELEAVKEQSRAGEAGGKGEAASLAIGLFGDGAKMDDNGDAGKTLSYLERGVRRMTKGLNEDE
ncbi:uncharacterized protein LTR77_000774 [Saxophila tyrrhenica]|uniref:Uncharacterized protein n=1 Tax=Saxophila tyrrhenica TaxID=1690608 RepID=A0AAV9PQ84_9PEZI|nr:hypothetical protein LTR77_000774 [Saxophila tyrrhenica]